MRELSTEEWTWMAYGEPPAAQYATNIAAVTVGVGDGRGRPAAVATAEVVDHTGRPGSDPLSADWTGERT
jgi:hypothetical protein